DEQLLPTPRERERPGRVRIHASAERQVQPPGSNRRDERVLIPSVRCAWPGVVLQLRQRSFFGFIGHQLLREELVRVQIVHGVHAASPPREIYGARAKVCGKASVGPQVSRWLSADPRDVLANGRVDQGELVQTRWVPALQRCLVAIRK